MLIGYQLCLYTKGEQLSNTCEMSDVAFRLSQETLQRPLEFIGEHMVGNPSVIEGQTVNIKNLQTGLWA